MPVIFHPNWEQGDNNNVNPNFRQADILKLIKDTPSYIVKVQPRAARVAINRVKADSSNVIITKGLHQVGTEHIDVQAFGYPTVHLLCLNYVLGETSLRPPYGDTVRASTGWRVVGSSVRDSAEELSGMDKTGEIKKLREGGLSKSRAEQVFRSRHYTQSND